MFFTCNKIVPLGEIEQWIDKRRGAGQTIATLNGSFDLLHPGHLQIIFEAKEQADCLLMLLNSDASIRQYKGLDRPILSLEERLKMVAALEPVDGVSWFEELNPCAILARIRPNVHINGAEYSEDCIEAEVVRQNGGRIHIVNLLPGFSTSMIIDKIQRLKR